MSIYEISKSSLLSLKAEILRKQEELPKVKQINEIKLGNIRKNSPLIKKSKVVDEKIPDEDVSEQENQLKKSQLALEAKAKLYDKLLKESSTCPDEENENKLRYLVQFDKKARAEKNCNNIDRFTNADNTYSEGEVDDDTTEEYDNSQDPDEEWVDYVDCLGRTRTCMKKDLPCLKSDDEKLKREVETKKVPSRNGENNGQTETGPNEDQTCTSVQSNELLSSDMRREFLRQQWEKEEEMLRDKANVHYQDLLFGEARSHGVGYYGFSKDEEERAKQQEALKKLRKETEEQQKKSQALKTMREEQMAARLKAARNRKRARMGLPPEEEEESNPEVKQPAEAPESEESVQKEDRNEEELAKESARRQHVRPWDIGKEGVKEHYVYTQEEWIDKKRKERPTEFAPPTYQRTFNSNVSPSISPDVPFLNKKQSVEQRTRQLKRLNHYKYVQQPELKEPVPIISEYEFGNTNTSENEYCPRDSSANFRGQGAEIAPPATYDYYGPSDVKKRKPAENIVLEESIHAGLKFLRNEFEKKEKSAKHPDEMFLM